MKIFCVFSCVNPPHQQIPRANSLWFYLEWDIGVCRYCCLFLLLKMLLLVVVVVVVLHLACSVGVYSVEVACNIQLISNACFFFQNELLQNMSTVCVKQKSYKEPFSVLKYKIIIHWLLYNFCL